MVLCKFFQSGYCRYGETCRFEHSGEGGFGGGGGGGGEHYGFRGHSQGYSSAAGYGQSPDRYSNYDNRGGYKNDNRGGYRSDYRNDYRNDNRSDFRNDNRNNNRSDYSSENRFAALDDRREGSRQPDSYQRGGGTGGRQYDSRYNYRKDQHKKDGEGEELTTAEILEGIAEDMELWETGKMWLFSSYGYTREMKSFPGLDDLSPEEVRMKAYEANSSGSMITHVNWLSQLTEDYKVKRAALRKPDPLARSALLNLIEQIKKSSSQNVSSTTAFTSGASAFTSPANAFGATTPVTNVFGATTPVTNVFGAATPATNVFGAAMPAANAFSGSAYSGNSPGFSMVTSAPIVPTSANAFGFGTSTQHTFSPAGMSPGFLPASNAGLSGTTNTQFSSQQSSPAQPCSSSKLLALYTPLVELTAEERAEFENPKFTLGHVPIRPPPKDLV